MYVAAALQLGVFGEDEVKTLSVMEGDSVTLNPDPTKMKGFFQMVWRFGDNGPSIAEIDESKISYKEDERFKNRLQLNQTGSLTIKNIRTKHSQLYKAEIDRNEGQLYMKFIVTVNEPPLVIDAGEAETKSVSVKEGYSVTLQTDITELQGDELIVWRFGDEGKLIAKSDIEAKSPPLYENTDERFRDRLQLNDQTGSLTIKNMRNTDSGLYRVKISSSKQMINKKFIVTVIGTGLSPGAVAGIVVLLVLAAAAAAVFGVFYYRHKISELERQKSITVKTITDVEGSDVTLHTGIEINKDVRLLWLFEDTNSLIADIKGGTEDIFIYDIGRFRDRLKLDKKTGDLTITNTTTYHTGLYKLKINSDEASTYRKFNVFVRAQIKEETPTYKQEGLELDETGSLTITNITAEHAGIYELMTSRRTSYRKFKLVVCDELVPATKGGSVTLKAGLPEIQKNDQILWMFEGHDFPIAEIKGGTGETPTYDDGPDGRFKDKLKLDMKTGDLTITNITAEHGGRYKLLTSSGNRATSKRFDVSVREKQVDESEMVLLDEEDPDVVNEGKEKWSPGAWSKRVVPSLISHSPAPRVGPMCPLSQPVLNPVASNTAAWCNVTVKTPKIPEPEEMPLNRGLTSVVVSRVERALVIHSHHLQSLPDLGLKPTTFRLQA
ncbi:T-lymphocyte surface antigen Ly-9 [Labeo rohita]|uniref:T-lymphocyte surface antigen Ly-9 n=1 Tax=Labeo rohita TaxID=84645 RepID=A0ABQ8LJD7_LABRO|nr:T-lymphocyte surface antigen Ly-9 [Labeo rohita]